MLVMSYLSPVARPRSVNVRDLKDQLVSLGVLRTGEQVGRAAKKIINSSLRHVPQPGKGETMARFQALMEVAAYDLGLARVVEAHFDALAIMAEAGMFIAMHEGIDVPLYAVWAARHNQYPLCATPEGNGWRISGALPFCSAAKLVQRALFVANDELKQLLFHLDAERFPAADDSQWYAAGLARVPAATLMFDNLIVARHHAIGAEGFYLWRKGFWAGAIGVAACWLGGAVGVLRRWKDLASQRPGSGHALAHFGASVAAVDAALAQLRQAAAIIDDITCDGAVLKPLALGVRHVIEQTCEDILRRFGRALGPGPLISDEYIARHVADLQIYLRQSHGERDLETLGGTVIRVPLNAHGSSSTINGGAYQWL